MPVGRDPYGTALAPDSRFNYSGNLAENTVWVIAGATLKVLATIAAFRQPRQGIVFARDGSCACVLNENLRVSKADWGTQQIIALTIALIAVPPAGSP